MKAITHFNNAKRPRKCSLCNIKPLKSGFKIVLHNYVQFSICEKCASDLASMIINYETDSQIKQGGTI